MKKLIAILVLATASTAAIAHDRGGFRGGYYHGGYRGGIGWVAPALIGGVVGYELAQPRYIQPAPTVIYQQQPVVVSPIAPAGYHYESILDARCNCYRTVLVQN